MLGVEVTLRRTAAPEKLYFLTFKKASLGIKGTHETASRSSVS